MPRILIVYKRKNQSFVFLEFDCIERSTSSELVPTSKEREDMLLHAEMYGNSVGRIRVHFDGFGTNESSAVLVE